MTAATPSVTLTTPTTPYGTPSLKLVALYHPSLPVRARAVGGRWSGVQKAWYFDTRDEGRVRQLCLSIYGTDPLAQQATARVTVRVALDGLTAGQELFLFGREVASRFGRDTPVRFGVGVTVVAGGFPAHGGSVKNPHLSPQPGTVLQIRDVPQTLVEGAPAWLHALTTIVPDAEPEAEPAQTGTPLELLCQELATAIEDESGAERRAQLSRWYNLAVLAGAQQ